MRVTTLLKISVFTCLGVVGCGGSSSKTVLVEESNHPVVAHAVSVTYQKADGNRVASGAIDLTNARRVDVPVAGTPKWLLSTEVDGDTAWVAISNDGKAQAFRLQNGVTSPVSVKPEKISADVLPVLVLDHDKNLLIANVLGGERKGLGPTVYFGNDSDKRAFVDVSGDLIVEQNGVSTRLGVNAARNARLLVDENERILFLAEPSTTRYDHQVLGSNSNTTRIVMVKTKDGVEKIASIDIPSPKVVEGNALVWADIDGDGSREIITTISDVTRGAYIAVYNELGDEIARSSDIGQGYRWRIQVALAPFDGQRQELLSVLYPHIGGVLEFFSLNGQNLSAATSNVGLTAHRNINQNIDMGLVGDFDPANGVEALIPSYDFTQWGVVSRQNGSITKISTIDIGNVMTSNPSTVSIGGQMLVGVGYENGVSIWY